MMQQVLIILILVVSIVGSACQSVSAPNANTASKNTEINTAPKNIPPEFSQNTVQSMGATPTPGIPADGLKPVPKGATPTPGIPENPGKPLPKGATPTPGIPDPETIKKQMNQNVDMNVVNNPPPTATGDSRPRRAGKP